MGTISEIKSINNHYKKLNHETENKVEILFYLGGILLIMGLFSFID
jgi:hypothetical protein